MLEVNSMIDVENVRNMLMIEERQAYENDFIAIEDILKSEEIDYTIFHHEYENESVRYTFDCEDYYLNLRDEKLIAERESYEASYLSDSVEKDTLDYIIESFDEFEYNHFEFDEYIDYEPVEYCYDCYNHNQLEAAYCANHIIGYPINDDPFEVIEDCDYPEGPNENINGFIYF